MAPAQAVWSINLEACDAFLAVASQFRESALDYAGAQAGLALAGITMSPELWSQVRLIEAGARDAAFRARSQ